MQKKKIKKKIFPFIFPAYKIILMVKNKGVYLQCTSSSSPGLMCATLVISVSQIKGTRKKKDH